MLSLIIPTSFKQSTLITDVQCKSRNNQKVEISVEVGKNLRNDDYHIYR